MEKPSAVSLVIFTCEGRELLLSKTITSFKQQANFNFDKVILSIDGYVLPEIVEAVNPDIVVQSTKRKGYVNSIMRALSVIDTLYFFWLEDDWLFSRPVDLEFYLQQLAQNPDWVEVFFSKHGPLTSDLKHTPLGHDLYQFNEFSANPCLCNTAHVKQAFELIATSPKGDVLGTDGFENSLTLTYRKNNLKCVIADPVDHTLISHEGYLESTPRNWHMTNSLQEKTKKHLLTIPSPSVLRKLYMILKLTYTFFKLAFTQLFSDKMYEYCFRIIAGAKNIKKDA